MKKSGNNFDSLASQQVDKTLSKSFSLEAWVTLQRLSNPYQKGL